MSGQQQFWMVLADNSKETTVRHRSLDDAQREAKRLLPTIPSPLLGPRSQGLHGTQRRRVDAGRRHPLLKAPMGRDINMVLEIHDGKKWIGINTFLGHYSRLPVTPTKQTNTQVGT